MAFQITWLKEYRVIHLQISGKFSDEELVTCSNQMRDDFLNIGHPPVHVICDVLGVTDYPRNIGVIKRGSQVYLSHSAMGWFIFLGFNTPIMRFLSNTIMQILMRNFKHARSLEEALAILCKVDSTTCDITLPS